MIDLAPGQAIAVDWIAVRSIGLLAETCEGRCAIPF